MSDEKLVSTVSLNDFFYSSLSKKNKHIPCPLPEEFIYYSSLTLEKYAFSNNFFENENGSINEKILGMQFLYSQEKSKEEKLKDLKDVGDTALVLLGFFSESVKSKLTNKSYYTAIAKNAYQQLNTMDIQFYDIPNFYGMFATSFETTVTLLEMMSEEFQDLDSSPYLLNVNSTNKKAV